MDDEAMQHLYSRRSRIPMWILYINVPDILEREVYFSRIFFIKVLPIHCMYTLQSTG